MKTALLIMEILTGLLFFATIVCGLWLRYSGEVKTESNKNFHMVIGLFTPIFAAITMLLLTRQ